MARKHSGPRRPPTRVDPISGPFPTPNEIASRAHDLFIADGRRVAKIFEYWRQAEHELLDIAARRTVTKEP